MQCESPATAGLSSSEGASLLWIGTAVATGLAALA
jgi:hypothetical protein